MRNELFAAAGVVFALAALTVGQTNAQDATLDEPENESSVVPGILLDDPQTGRIGELSAWLFYSSAYGVTGGTSGKFKFPSGEGRSILIGAELAERRQFLRLAYHQDTAFDTDAALDVTLRGSHQEARKVLPFESASVGVEGRLTWTQESKGTIAGYFGVSNDRIFNAKPSLSAIIVPDLKRSDRGYAGFSLTRSVDLGEQSATKLQYTLGGEVASISTGAAQFRGQAGVLAAGLVDDGALSWRADLRGGLVETSKGGSSIGERFILGGASLRGFAFGGFGPHDVDQSLGGNRYAVARFDLQFPHAFGDSAWVVPGVHADVGSLWGLDNTGGGLVDDTAKLRGSFGLTFTAKLPSGGISLSVSKAVKKEVNDETQLLQLSLHTKF